MDIHYKIIGGDGAEYGPAALAELKNWIRDGRVAGMTKVWRSDLSIWSPADRYNELHAELTQLHQAAAAAVNRALPPAGFWARLAAYIIDNVLLTVLFLLIWTPIATPRHWQIPEPPQTWTDPAVVESYRIQISDWWVNKAAPIFLPIFMLYEVLLTGRFGATIGKMAIGAKITLLDGSPIGYTRALLRWLAARISDFLLFTGYLLIALRRDKRALHDLMAGTKVVFKR